MTKTRTLLLFLSLLLTQFYSLESKVHPVQFAIPESKVIGYIPTKTQDFAFLVPGDLRTYVYLDESEYYRDYQRSYFAYTWRKGGWDCMRHYEILANGCIPYFVDLEKADPNTMYFLPKELILEAMHLPGVSRQGIDHRIFDRDKYYALLDKILAHTREHLTTKAMAAYILQAVGYRDTGKILYLSEDVSPDYLRCSMLIGFKELLGERVVDVPKVPHIYKNYPGDEKALYGHGFSYTKIVDDLPIDRENMERRIREKEFDLIIYGSVHRGLRYHHLVQQFYPPEQILYLCGEDAHKCQFAHLPTLFLREFEALR